MSEKGSNPNPLSSLSDGSAHLHREAVAGRPPLFSGISADDYAAISAARAKELTRGEVLYLEGDAVEQILVLTSGSVKTTRLGLSGVEVILRLWVPGGVLGPTDLLAGGRHSSRAHAFRLTVWDASSFRLWRTAIRSWTGPAPHGGAVFGGPGRAVPRNGHRKSRSAGGLVSWCDSGRRSAGRPMGPSK